MLEGNFWAIKNVRLTLIAPLIVATASVSFAPRAEAAGTVAGSTITNTATANYTDAGGNAQTATSNTANLRVDELLDVAVTSADPGDIPTLPSGVNQVASFTVTNTGNGSDRHDRAGRGSIRSSRNVYRARYQWERRLRCLALHPQRAVRDAAHEV